MDLKATFDSVNRVKLIESMRKSKVKGLVKRCGDVLRKTSFRVKIEKELGKEFWTGREVRQGCPLSPMLFNLLIADLEMN